MSKEPKVPIKEPNVPIMDRTEVEEPALHEALDHVDTVGTPPPEKLLAMAHAPAIASAFAQYWRTVAEDGRVEREIKELGRLAIAQLLGCDVCSRAQATDVERLDEETLAVCTLPDFDHPDPRTGSALRYARTLVLDDGRDAERYAELRQHYDWAEIIELASFFCLVVGDVRMVKSFGLEGVMGS